MTELVPSTRDLAAFGAAVERNATLMVAKDAWLDGRPIGPVLEGNGIADGPGESELAKGYDIGRHDEIEWDWVFEEMRRSRAR